MKIKVTSNLGLLEWIDLKNAINGKVLDYGYMGNKVIYKVFDVDHIVSSEVIQKFNAKVEYIDTPFEVGD